jgi:putative MATE family efflux protein
MTTRPARPNLVHGPIGRTLLLFTLPTLASNVLQSLNASVNAIWIGKYLGEAALTASANANIVLFFLLGVVFGIAMATGILIGHSIGADNTDQAKRVVGSSAAFFALLSSVVAVLGFLFAPYLLAAMQTPADAMPFAISYLRIIFVATPAMFIYQYIMMALRGAGDAKTPFIYMLWSVGLDIALNPLFIFGWGPIPALGIAGSATATLVAQTSTLIMLVLHLYRHKHVLCIHRDEVHYLKPDPVILKALVLRGIPMGLQMTVVSSSMIGMFALVNRFGSQTSAAFGAILQLWTYIQMPAFAVGTAVTAMVAQNVGAGRWDRVSRIAWSGMGFNLLLTGIPVLFVYAFNRAAVSLFLPPDGMAIDIAAHANLVTLWSFIVFGVTFVLLSVPRATGAVMGPLLILAVALWVIRFPFALLLTDRLQVDALWWSFPVGTLAMLILTAGYYWLGNWKGTQILTTRQ